MTPIHSSIFHALLPVCLKATTAARPKNVTKNKEVEEKAKELANYINNNPFNIQDVYKKWQAQCFYIMLGGGEALVKIAGASTVYKPFVVINSPYSGKDRFRIVTHSKSSPNANILEINGSIAEWGLGSALVASDEEVEKCLSDLTPGQLRTIMSEPTFLPIIQPLFEEQTELVEVKEGAEKVK